MSDIPLGTRVADDQRTAAQYAKDQEGRDRATATLNKEWVNPRSDS